MGFEAFCVAGEMVAVPGALLSGTMLDWGDAYAGVSCRVQLGAPPQPSCAAWLGLFARRSSAGALTVYAAGETPALPGHRAYLWLSDA